jgi:hypothetical protein
MERAGDVRGGTSQTRGLDVLAAGHRAPAGK